jgi:uncharacterized protein
MSEPRFRREGCTRDMVLPGNKKFVKGDVLPRSGGEGRGRPTEPGEGDSEDAFRFVLSRDEFVDLFLDDLELPDLAKRKLAEAESEGLRRAGYLTSGSPANISVSRTVQLAMARRIALRRPRPETIAQLEAEIANCDEALRLSRGWDHCRAAIADATLCEKYDRRSAARSPLDPLRAVTSMQLSSSRWTGS